MKWRMEPVQPWGLVVGLMTHCFNFKLSGSGSSASGLRSNICMVKDCHFNHIVELATGVDHHVRLLAAVAAIEIR